MKREIKLSDEQFLSILRENGGLFARTARAIKKQFKIEYSRQAVRDRAENHPDEVLDIAEENLDIAEEGLLSIMRNANDQVRLRAIELYLKSKGKKRGYVEKQEFDLTNKGKRFEPIDYSKLDESVLRAIVAASKPRKS
jgi:predicted transcriptional regulator